MTGTELQLEREWPPLTRKKLLRLSTPSSSWRDDATPCYCCCPQSYSFTRLIVNFYMSLPGWLWSHMFDWEFPKHSSSSLHPLFRAFCFHLQAHRHNCLSCKEQPEGLILLCILSGGEIHKVPPKSIRAAHIYADVGLHSLPLPPS